MHSVSGLFETEGQLPIFRGSCSNLELMRFLLIIWIAVMVYWQYFIIKFLFQEANFSPHQRRQLLEFALVLFLLTIWISDCICLAHIIEISMHSLSGSFETKGHLPIYWGSCSNLELIRFLLIIWIAVIVYWQYFIIMLYFRKQISLPSMKAVVRTSVCAVSLDYLDFRFYDWVTSSKSGWIHCQFYLETEVQLPTFRGSCLNLELMQIILIIWIAVMVYWQYFIIKKWISESKFLFPNMKPAIRTWDLCCVTWPFGFQIVYVWLI